MRAVIFLIAAAMLGLAGGYGWSQWSTSSPAAAANAANIPPAGPNQTSHDVEQSTNYANCAEVRAAGKAPLYAGQPGYRAELDPDGTGLACRPEPASS